MDNQSVEAGRVCQQHCGHDLTWMFNGECHFADLDDNYPRSLGLRCGHRCSPSPRICQRGVDGSPGCGHAAYDAELERCLASVPDGLDGLQYCSHRCDFSPVVSKSASPAEQMRGHRAGCFCKGNDRDPRCDPDAPPLPDAVPSHELKPDDAGQVYYPGIVDQKTLSACLETAEQIIRDGVAGVSGVAKIQRFRSTKLKLIAQVKAHPLSFDEWNANPTVREPRNDLSADCQNGNHSECLYQWPDPSGSVNPDQTERLITCGCSCHATNPAVPSERHEYKPPPFDVPDDFCRAIVKSGWKSPNAAFRTCWGSPSAEVHRTPPTPSAQPVAPLLAIAWEAFNAIPQSRDTQAMRMRIRKVLEAFAEGKQENG